MPLRLQSVCLYRSYRQEARQAAAAACSSPAAFLKGIGLRIYGNAVSAQRISVNLGAAPCSQCSQGSANISSPTFLRLSLHPSRAAFIAAPKALKSYRGTGLFAIVIHPITFYCSPFFLDMST